MKLTDHRVSGHVDSPALLATRLIANTCSMNPGVICPNDLYPID